MIRMQLCVCYHYEATVSVALLARIGKSCETSLSYTFIHETFYPSHVCRSFDLTNLLFRACLSRFTTPLPPWGKAEAVAPFLQCYFISPLFYGVYSLRNRKWSGAILNLPLRLICRLRPFSSFLMVILMAFNNSSVSGDTFSSKQLYWRILHLFLGQPPLIPWKM
jgi:hypothetical protein